MVNRPLTLADLESDLWACAQILRGSAIDRTDWKGWILPLLFFKRISDVWDEETAEARATYGDADLDAFPELHRFALPAGCLFRKGRAQNFLDPEHAERIVGWVRRFRDVPDRAKVVSTDEIAAEDWTLNISRYVPPPVGADVPPLPEAVAAFKQALAEARSAEDRLRRVLADDGWLE